MNEPSIEYQIIPAKNIDKIKDPRFIDSHSIAVGRCKHSYHVDCIETWLKNNSICPLCSGKWEYDKILNLFLNNH